jgi:hypothetical protein
MNIEHVRFLSWFSDGRKSHEQDGETLCHAGDPRLATASGDPAMAFGPFVGDRAFQSPERRQPLLPDLSEGWNEAIRSNMRGSTRAGWDQRRMPSRSIRLL